MKDKSLSIPILGQIANLVRTSGGTSVQDAHNPFYSSFIDRLETIAMKWGKVVFVSGHDHSLQYLEDGHIKQVVSGSGATTSRVKKGGKSLFAQDTQGFAVLVFLTTDLHGLVFMKLKEISLNPFSKQKFIEEMALLIQAHSPQIILQLLRPLFTQKKKQKKRIFIKAYGGNAIEICTNNKSKFQLLISTPCMAAWHQ